MRATSDEGRLHRDSIAPMVSSVFRVSAKRESSVLSLGCRDKLGIMTKLGSSRSFEHQGMDRKYCSSGSAVAIISTGWAKGGSFI